MAAGPLNWPLLVDLAWFHGVGPLASRALNSVCPDLMPKETRDGLRHRTQAERMANHALTRELVQICRVFSEEGIPVIPFKGVTLAMAAYGDTALRDFDDLDFIVPQHRVSDAQQILWSQGYCPRDHSREDRHGDEPYHVFVKGSSLLRVDLQWVMAHDQFAFRLDRSDVWERRVPMLIEGSTISTLAHEELLIVLCVHGSKHAWERLKWVVDVAELLRAQRLDWEHV
ncbi:MAG TPA: nucleotidyltransferase family protein, partial [Nitrospira sp.]